MFGSVMIFLNLCCVTYYIDNNLRGFIFLNCDKICITLASLNFRGTAPPSSTSDLQG